MTIALMMAIKVMAVENGVVAVVELVVLDEVVASTTAAKNPVISRFITVPTSRIGMCLSQCTSINLLQIEQIFMSCAWLACRRKYLRAIGRSMPVRLSPCSVSLMNPE